mmetsp:Transcript_32049/g.76478  ORF Transcript_32049/g.76478 Transcript_32049/m.76478 type:complete len:240 (+) Transcript_32049:1374-2093(+)
MQQLGRHKARPRPSRQHGSCHHDREDATGSEAFLGAEEGQVAKGNCQDHLRQNVAVVTDLLAPQAQQVHREPTEEEAEQWADHHTLEAEFRQPCRSAEGCRIHIFDEHHLKQIEEDNGSAVVEQRLATDQHGQPWRHPQGVEDGHHRHRIRGRGDGAKGHGQGPVPLVGQNVLGGHAGQYGTDNHSRHSHDEATPEAALHHAHVHVHGLGEDERRQEGEHEQMRIDVVPQVQGQLEGVG